MSYAEELCSQSLGLILTKDVDVIRNYRPDFLKNPQTGRNLEYDFYLPSLKLAIEIQGPSHYDDPVVIQRDKLKLELSRTVDVEVMLLTPHQVATNALYKKLLTFARSRSYIRPSWLRQFDVAWCADTRVKDYKNLPFSKHECTLTESQREIAQRNADIQERLKYTTYVKTTITGHEVVGRVVSFTQNKAVLLVDGRQKIVKFSRIRFME